MIDSKKIYSLLKKAYPDAHCELIHETPFQLLVATILSAQCTDIQVNKVTPKLFDLYPSASALAQASLAQIEELIRSIGLYKNKAKNILSAAQIIAHDWQNMIPSDIDRLQELPGVGRKTANVVLSNAFNINHGIVVDTHVKRISRLLHLTYHDNPEKIEKDLMQLFPQEQWGMLSHLLIFHGRKTCQARKPLCHQCCLKNICPSQALSTKGKRLGRHQTKGGK